MVSGCGRVLSLSCRGLSMVKIRGLGLEFSGSRASEQGLALNPKHSDSE